MRLKGKRSRRDGGKSEIGRGWGWKTKRGEGGDAWEKRRRLLEKITVRFRHLVNLRPWVRSCVRSLDRSWLKPLANLYHVSTSYRREKASNHRPSLPQNLTRFPPHPPLSPFLFVPLPPFSSPPPFQSQLTRFLNLRFLSPSPPPFSKPHNYSHTIPISTKLLHPGWFSRSFRTRIENLSRSNRRVPKPINRIETRLRFEYLAIFPFSLRGTSSNDRVYSIVDYSRRGWPITRRGEGKGRKEGRDFYLFANPCVERSISLGSSLGRSAAATLNRTDSPCGRFCWLL